MADDWYPDIVVGVDFGMTCTGAIGSEFPSSSLLSSSPQTSSNNSIKKTTGVAYSYGPTWPTPKSIQHWPGLIGSQVATKVPSHILYHNNAVKWGFQCEENLPDTKDIKQYFKLNLDPAFVDNRPNAPSREDATRYFQDYIRCIYQYVLSYFAKTFPRFEGMRVEWVFSVPTTWKDPRMVAELRERIVFDRPEHRAVIGLTEAEAAAVYVSGLHYQVFTSLGLEGELDWTDGVEKRRDPRLRRRRRYNGRERAQTRLCTRRTNRLQPPGLRRRYPTLPSISSTTAKSTKQTQENPSAPSSSTWASTRSSAQSSNQSSTRCPGRPKTSPGR
jgi:hypothetical protein